MTEKTRFIYKDNSMWFSFIDRQTGKHLNAIMCCNLMNELHEENIMLKQKIDRQLHRNKRYSRQNEEVMGFLHDNYYSIWEEVLKECYHD